MLMKRKKPKKPKKNSCTDIQNSDGFMYRQTDNCTSNIPIYHHFNIYTYNNNNPEFCCCRCP